jgi:hypothetical protein
MDPFNNHWHVAKVPETVMGELVAAHKTNGFGPEITGVGTCPLVTTALAEFAVQLNGVVFQVNVCVPTTL